MAIHSVSEINQYIKGLLDREPIMQSIMIRGEVSNFKRYPSGHCYFTLKDAQSALKCVMFRSRAQYLRFNPTNGLKVVASGNISVYERDGVYQLYADSLAPEGTGDLALAFEQLKAKLTAEGLFDAAYKQPLPKFPKRIGVVTSSAGAVLRDIYHVAKRRWPAIQLVLYPVQVQGEGSAQQIAEAVRFFNAKDPVDVLIVGRGGGSIEDLWSFNEEIVVRAVFESKIPVISAVGHETDFTLADFAADVRAATPSQAAELAVPDRAELQRYVAGLMARVQQQTHKTIENKRLQLMACLQSRVMLHPQTLLAERRQRLDHVLGQLQQIGRQQLQERQHRLDLATGKLSLLNPAHVLKRGYAVAEKQGIVVTSAGMLKAGDQLDLILKDGRCPIQVLKQAGKEDR